MRKLTTLKKTLIALLAVGLVAIPVSSKALSEWGPDRPTFTIAHPATYVTFNSITDNTQFTGAEGTHDERNFYSANHAGTPDYSHNLTVNDNDEVALRAYFHNNAAANLNLIAFNSNVKMTLPTSEASNQTSVSYISASNANPSAVWDTIHLSSSKPFTLEYEKGTAKLYTNALNGAQLSDSIVTDAGAPIGYNSVNGQIPGCLNFSGYVTIKVKVHVKPTPPPPTPPVPPQPPKPPVTPTGSTTPAPTPTQLVNTGPGEVAGLFAIVTATGVLVYRRLLSRRLS